MALTKEEALRILEAQRTEIERVAIEKDYNPLYQKLLPVHFSGNPFAQAVAFLSHKGVGEANWIGDSADDIPLADLEQQGKVVPVHSAAIGYGYDFFELGRDQALTADKAKAARQAYEKFVDQVGLRGRADKNLKGLFNLDAADRNREHDNSDWGAANTDKLLGIIFDALSATGEDGEITANTLLLPASVYTKLARTYVTDTKTGLSLLQETNPFTMETGQAITVRGFKYLETAGTASKKRIVAYRNDEDTLRLHIPMAHRFLETYQAGPTRWEVPGVFRIAGLNVINKNNVAYLDNHSS